MPNEDIYSAPKSTIDSPEGYKPSVLVIIMAVVFSVPIVLIMFVQQSSAGGIAAGFGGIVGSFIPALVVVLMFQIGKRFRNSRSRWKIFMWTQFVAFLGQIPSILQSINANA